MLVLCRFYVEFVCAMVEVGIADVVARRGTDAVRPADDLSERLA